MESITTRLVVALDPVTEREVLVVGTVQAAANRDAGRFPEGRPRKPFYGLTRRMARFCRRVRFLARGVK